MRLFASDLDGTLLDRFHNLDKQEEKLVKELIAKGYLFSVVTGRSKHSVLEFFKDVESYNYIVLNGSQAYNHQHELIYDAPLSADKCGEVVSLLRSSKQHYIIYSKEDIFCNNRLLQAIFTYKWSRSIRKSLAVFRLFQSMKEINFPVYKIESLITDKKVVEHLYRLEGVKVVKSGEYLYEITDLKASKKMALLALANHYSVDENDVCCFGDGENDLEMLKHFKHAYVMGNAKEYVRKQIPQVIGKNTEHAVYNKIKEILNEK